MVSSKQVYKSFNRLTTSMGVERADSVVKPTMSEK